MTDDTLLIDEDDRYSRLRLIAWWEQDKLTSAKVLVVGAGALGNEVLKNLALLGVGTVYLVDFDTIEESNLTRSVLFRRRDCGRDKAIAAAEALYDMNPDTNVIAARGNVITDVGLGLFRDVDVVIGCLDNREARLWVNRQCWKVGTPWVDGGIQEINGVCKVFAPPDGACYECAMTETDYRLINLRYSCPLLRQEDLLAGKVPTAPTISSMIGGMQTQEALKLIHGMNASDGQALVYNGVVNNFYKTRYQRRESCLSHETYPEPIALPLSAHSHTAMDLFDMVRQRLGVAPEMHLELDRDLVESLRCQACHLKRPIMKPLQLVSMRDAACEGCGQTMPPHLTHVISSNDVLANEQLKRLGIPPYDIVRVTTSNGEHAILLANDAESPFGPLPNVDPSS